MTHDFKVGDKVIQVTASTVDKMFNYPDEVLTIEKVSTREIKLVGKPFAVHAHRFELVEAELILKLHIDTILDACDTKIVGNKQAAKDAITAHLCEHLPEAISDLATYGADWGIEKVETND